MLLFDYERADFADFAKALISNQPYAKAEKEGISFLDPRLLKQFQNLAEGKPAILLYANPTDKARDSWLITAKYQAELEYFLQVIARFVVPSYTNFSDNRVQMQLYNRPNALHHAGDKLFAGYYRWESFSKDRDTILKKIDEGLELLASAKIPPVIRLDRNAYRYWFEQFQLSLSAQQWDDANQIIETISGLSLTTAENLSFMRIEWLARQGSWGKIYSYPQFRSLAQISPPRPIRAALLTAFHYEKLLSHERNSDWEKCIKVFEANRDQLGLLLSGRFGIRQNSVLRVFAYLAVCDKDRDAFQRVKIDVLESDFETKYILDQLENLIPVTDPIDTRSTLEKALYNLHECNYEAAWYQAESIEDYLARVEIQLTIAATNNDLLMAQNALNIYEAMYPEDKRELERRYVATNRYLGMIQGFVAKESKYQFQNWGEWFEISEKRELSDEILSQSLDYLLEIQRNTFWDPTNLLELTNHLIEIPNDKYRQNSAYKALVEKLVSFYLVEDLFPRFGDLEADLYELIQQFLLQGEKTERTSIWVLHLTEGVLANKPSQIKDAIMRVQDWFETPRLVLQTNALEAIELLVYYGASANDLYVWYRHWATNICNIPQEISISDLLVWQSFASWFDSPDINEKLQQRIEKQQKDENTNLVASLTADYQIAIFTFDSAAANRAKQLLLNSNPHLDIRLCHERDNSKTVESLAANADMVVLVTSCTSHAIWYAIKPIVADKLVYPKSRGASSILKSIDEYLQG